MADRLVKGTVRDNDGAPIANARVTAHADWTRVERGTHTALDGTFELALPARSHQLVVAHDDYCGAWENVDVRDQDRSADFALVRGAVVRGRVVTRDTGKPLARATVHVFGGEDYASERADDDGAFTLRTLHRGVAIISARGRGYASSTPTLVDLDAGAHVDDAVVLVDPALSIAGRVVLHDAPSEGIAAVTVTAQSRGGSSASAISDPDGGFEIHGLAPGRYYVRADGGGIPLANGVTMDVADRNLVDVVLVVRRGVTLSGRVEPPCAARIGLAALGPDPAHGMRNLGLHRVNTESDDAGAFTMRGVPEGDFEIFAMASDGRCGRVPVTVGGEDADGFVIHLSPRRSVSGRVVDTAGEPLAGYHVLPSLLDVSMERRHSTDSSYRAAITAVDGTFTIVGLEPGRHELSALPGKGRHGSAVVTVDLTDGDRGDVAVVVDVPTAQLRGHVLGVDNQPAPGVFVMATCGPHIGGAQTDRHGSFVIDGVPAGTYALFVHGPHPVRASAAVAQATTDEPVEIVLSPLGTVTVEASRGGVPARGIALSCWGARYRNQASDVDGSHTFTDVPAGEVTCIADGLDGVAMSRITIAGGHDTVHLELTDGASISGVVVNVLTGEPVPSITIAARTKSTVTDEAGRFVLDRVAPGNVRLSIRANDLWYPPETREYTAIVGERADVGRIEVVAPRTGAPGTFGFTLEARDGALRVAHVAKAGPADRAAITVGDEIAFVEGRAVNDLGVERARLLIASDNVTFGQTVTVELGTGRSVTMTSITW